MTNRSSSYECLTWEQARPHIQKVNPAFAAAIDSVSPGEEYRLYRVRYPYGEKISELGEVRLPTSRGEFAPISDHVFSSRVQDDLAGQGIPMGVLTKKSIELVIDGYEAYSAFYLKGPGHIFGLWYHLDGNDVHYHPESVWTVYSGARSIFMLPPISDNAGYHKLKDHYKCRLLKPGGLQEHSKLFSKISSLEEDGWECEVIYFSNKWHNHLNDIAWAKYNYFLYQTAWEATKYWRNKAIFDSLAARAQVRRNLRPNPVLADIAKHLLSISAGVSPCFIFARDDSAAPVSKIQQVFMDVFQLKKYAPVIMHIDHIDFLNRVSAGFYSLRYNSCHEMSPASRRSKSIIGDLKEVKYILYTIKEFFLHSKFCLRNHPLVGILSSVEFDFFHNDADWEDEIISTKKLFEDGRYFQNVLSIGEGVFCETGSFLRGCVRIRSR